MATKKKKEKKIQKGGNSTIGFLLPKAIDFHTHKQLLGIFHSATESPIFSLRMLKTGPYTEDRYNQPIVQYSR